ncbi:hypothetical protein QJS10_CPB15g01338 [Acorus calamus]|uniref:Uncharacterized protein n=1 Tax=Acorus calamus TaxID=4465 RepID=A0AAV9D8Z7_ACOCL|nr:hypothetical protein QJS10_CPB15g01338 [Acorus calamus]
MAWKVVTVAVVAVVAVLHLSTVSAKKYDVNWSPGVNLTQWAAKYHFYEGDWLAEALAGEA